jgi:hypothetical protein
MGPAQEGPRLAALDEIELHSARSARVCCLGAFFEPAARTARIDYRLRRTRDATAVVRTGGALCGAGEWLAAAASGC